MGQDGVTKREVELMCELDEGFRTNDYHDYSYSLSDES